MDYNKISLLVADSINDLVYLADIETYELLYINKNTISAFSKADKNFTWEGQKCYKVLQGKDAPCSFCTNKYLKSDKFYEWEYYNPLTKTHYSLKDKLVEIEGKMVRLEIAIDSTHQYFLTNNLEKKLLEHQVVASCIENLHKDFELEEALLDILEILGEYYKAQRCYIFTLSQDKKTVSNDYEWTDGVSKPSKSDLTNVDALPFQRWFDVFQTQNELVLLDSSSAILPKPERDLLEKYDVRNLLAVPLRDIKGDLYGFIGVDNPTLFNTETKIFRELSFIISSFFEKNKILKKLNKLSFYDKHSNLKNRNAYNEHIKSFNEETPDTLGVLVLDIKSLKLINDLHGYEHGDKVILTLASLLKSVFEDYHIYRLGGDDFVILCDNLSEEEFESLVFDFQTMLKTLDFEVSVGYAFNRVYDSEDFNFLLDKSKTQTGNYTNLLLKNLGYELLNNKFTVFLQPQIELSTNKIIGAEALIRKFDSKGNIKTPNTFLPFYEKESIISNIDYYVFKTICEFINDLNQRGYQLDLRFSVNFSRKSLTSVDVIEKLINICETFNVSPDYFIVEVTETVTGIDDVHLIELINEFNRAGFLVSLDDFGSGYSNLSIISKANFHEIKIDKTIIDTFIENKKANIITKWSIDLCKNFNGIISVAEGVETENQKDALQKLGCDIGQGYYFSKPIPMDEFFKKYIDK